MLKPKFFTHVLPALAAAAACFLLLALFAASPPKGEILNWQYGWSKEPWEQPFNTLGQAQNLTKPQQAAYLHLRTHVSLSRARTLTLQNAYNPMRVMLNGSPAFSSGYPTSQFAAARTAAISLPAGDTTVDIYLYAPLAFSFTATLYEQNTVLLAGLGAGGCLIGLLIFLCAFLFSVGHKGFGRMMLLGLQALLLGIVPLLLYQQDMGFSFTLFSPFSALAALLILLYFIGGAIASRTTGAALFLMGLGVLLAGAAVIVPLSGLVWLLPVSLAVMAVSSCLVFVQLLKAVYHSAPNGRFMLLSYAVLFLALLWFGLSLYLPLGGKLWPLLAAWGLYVIAQFIVLTREAIHTNIRQDERDLQEEQNLRWIGRMVTVCGRIYAEHEVVAFCRETAFALRELACDWSDAPRRASLCAALQADNAFIELCSEGAPHCDYGIVEAHTSEAAPLFFGPNYIDACLFHSRERLCYIHIENLPSLPDKVKFVTNMAFANLTVALSNLKLKADMLHTQESVFLSLAEIAETKSEGSKEHLFRVADYSAALAQQLGMEGHELEVFIMASMVHDIGKLAIPEQVIAKRGRLSREEFNMVKEHVAYGRNMLQKTKGEFMEAAAVIAQQHHERFDGTGYLGLQGEDIHPYARIVTVADVFDALTTTRSYKQAWSFAQASEYIISQSGTQFDPLVIEAFRRAQPAFKAILQGE